MTKRIILFFVMIFAVNGFSGGYIGGEWYPWWDGTAEGREECLYWDCTVSFRRLEIVVTGIRDIDEDYMELEYSSFKAFVYNSENAYSIEEWPLENGRPIIEINKKALFTWLRNNSKELKFTNNYWEDELGNIIDGVEPIEIQFNRGKSAVEMIETTPDASKIFILDHPVG